MFPPGFRFGAATAAYQVEGAASEDGRGPSIWDTFSHTPGRVANGDTGDVACDHYHRWREDLDLMARLGVESYRFSIGWPRVQPDGRGAPNRRGVDFYRQLVDGLLERGIEPVATLYHWDLPQALQDAGGWAERDTCERFAEYAGLMAAELGDTVSAWITHNEPWVVSILGYVTGDKAPGDRDWGLGLRVAHHVLLSHGLAVPVLRAGTPDVPVGITMNLSPVWAESDADRDAATRMDGHLNRWYLDPVLRGSYPPDMVVVYGSTGFVQDGDLATISAPIDFLGVNYYSPARVRAGTELPLRAERVPGPGTPTAMGWEVNAGGLHELLVRLRADYGEIPIHITENGAAYDDPPPSGGAVDDPERLDYLRTHLGAVARAIADGVDVRRYFAWSLLDNFEWEHGYAKRFGIVHVDFETQERTPKSSALWYRDFIAGQRGD